MQIKKEGNLWHCIIKQKDIDFYVDDYNKALKLAWEMMTNDK